MNVVSQTITPEGIVLVTTSGREYEITRQMLRAAYLASQGTEAERKASAISACKAVRGIKRVKPDHLFAVRYRDKAKEVVDLGNEAKKTKAEREAASDDESPWLNDSASWRIDFDPADGSPTSLVWEPV